MPQYQLSFSDLKLRSSYAYRRDINLSVYVGNLYYLLCLFSCCSILNKLTPERFDKLSLELLNVGIGSEKTLRGLIILVSIAELTPSKYSQSLNLISNILIMSCLFGYQCGSDQIITYKSSFCHLCYKEGLYKSCTSIMMIVIGELF